MKKTSRNRPRTYFYLIAGSALTTVAVLVFTTKAYKYIKPQPAFKPETCYKMAYRTLPDISSSRAPQPNSIFFVDTSCGPRLAISPRQACAVESAASKNPNRRVYLLYISPELDEDDILRHLRSYENVHVVRLNVEKFLSKTPVEGLLQKMGRWKNVQRELSHVLRFLVLWRYGGVYLDLDSVVLKSLEELPSNYAALEDSTSVGCSVLSFAATGQGYDVARQCLEQLANNFREDIPGANCVGLITRVLKTACNAYEAIDMEGETCQGVHVLPGEAFYPMRYMKHFYSDSEEETAPLITNNSYVVHPWDELSKLDKQVGKRKDGKPYYVAFLEKFCPETYSGHREFFEEKAVL